MGSMKKHISRTIVLKDAHELTKMVVREKDRQTSVGGPLDQGLLCRSDLPRSHKRSSSAVKEILESFHDVCEGCNTQPQHSCRVQLSKDHGRGGKRLEQIDDLSSAAMLLQEMLLCKRAKCGPFNLVGPQRLLDVRELSPPVGLSQAHELYYSSPLQREPLSPEPLSRDCVVHHPFDFVRPRKFVDPANLPPPVSYYS